MDRPASSPVRTGVLVLRVWIEPPAGEFRARLTRTVDLSRQREESSSAGSVEDVCAQVRAWLDQFVL